MRVDRVVAAVDCGHVVNPGIVEAQIQSGVIYGLSAALYGEITIKNGRVEQSNFGDYQVVSLTKYPVFRWTAPRSSSSLTRNWPERCAPTQGEPCGL